MKKILTVMVVAVTLASCGNGETSVTGDSANTTSPSVIEDTSTQHPNGVTHDGVISTDTSAFGVNANKADSTKK